MTVPQVYHVQVFWRMKPRVRDAQNTLSYDPNAFDASNCEEPHAPHPPARAGPGRRGSACVRAMCQLTVACSCSGRPFPARILTRRVTNWPPVPCRFPAHARRAGSAAAQDQQYGYIFLPATKLSS